MSCPSYVYATSSVENPILIGFADYVRYRTGIPQSVIMAQVLDETGALSSEVWKTCLNPAGIKSTTGQPTPCQSPSGDYYASYTSVAEAAQAYADVYLGSPYYYGHVLSVARSGASAYDVAAVLGQSQWAGSHYECGGVEGGVLQAIIRDNNLTRFDRTVTRADLQNTFQTLHVEYKPLLTCPALGSYVGEGASVGVEAGLALFRKSANGVIVDSVVHPGSCVPVATYKHSPPQTTPLQDIRSAIGKAAKVVGNPANWWAVGLFSVLAAATIAGYDVKKST